MNATFEQEILSAHREGCPIEMSGRRKSRNWYGAVGGGKCPVCGEVPQFEEVTIATDPLPEPAKLKKKGKTNG